MQTKPIEASGAKYRWTYEMSLFKNPTIFLTTAKAMGITVAVTVLIIGLISLFADGFSADAFRFIGELTLILCGKQAKKAENIGFAAMIMGLLAHNRGAVSAGYTAGSRMTSTVEFDRVKKVTIDKKHSVIRIRSIGWDQVYADGEDFDFVAGWIRNHVPETAEWTVKG